MNKRIFVILFVVLIAFMIGGCSDESDNIDLDENGTADDFSVDTDEFEFTESIRAILGIEYAILWSELNSFEMPDGRMINWYFIDLLGNELLLDDFEYNDNGNVLGSQTGDAIYVIIDGLEFIYIDLGSAQPFGWSEQHRMYSVFSLNPDV